MKLKPCPFCNSSTTQNQHRLSSRGLVGFYYVLCLKCGAEGPMSDTFDAKNDYAEKIAKQTAGRRWNRRKGETGESP